MNYHTNLAISKDKQVLPLKELQTFSEVFHHIKTSYHKDISDEELIQAAIKGMLNSVGEHTKYYSPQEFAYFNRVSDGGQADTLTPNIISTNISDNIGYIAIAQFTSKTPDELVKHINNLMQNYDTKKLILDLRNNLGGVVEASEEIANMFLRKGSIYFSKGKSTESNRNVLAQGRTIFPELILLVMINRNTASSSEILAGALQDNKRAIIFGENSYGKGTIQTVFALRNGSAIKLTTSEYFTPNGNAIQQKGITPDIIGNTKNMAKQMSPPIFNDLEIFQAYLHLMKTTDK
ncbi:MAG: S41 family peptidase [Kangiellaceae bacterium]